MTPVTILFNPHSTGDSEIRARRLADQLEGLFEVTVVATKFQGHAEKLAAQITKESESIHVIVCSSGDGTYNEVVNGVMRHPHDHIRTAILPSGNANDHYHALSNGKTLAHRIITSDYTDIDVLKLVSTGRDNLERYAHSYIGFGLTPHIGEKLTEAHLTKWNQGWIVLKNLFSVKPVKIIHEGHQEKFDNLVFANVPRMSKVIKISDHTSLTNGKFDVVKHKSLTLAMLIGYLFRASTLGLHNTDREKRWHFILEKDSHVQLDGEVMRLSKYDEITISVVPHTLACAA